MESVNDFTSGHINELEFSTVPVLSAAQSSVSSATILPLWSLWFSTIVLSITFAVGLPLNALTVLIFLRWKKLRHLVNFVLLLDCLSHILVCLVGFPIHIVSVWSGSYLAEHTTSDWLSLDCLQQVVRNFTNLYGTFLSLSIAILRYRRLCWKKKDKFGTWNALKWSLSNGIPALALTLTQSWTGIQLKTLSPSQKLEGIEANSEFHNDPALEEAKRLASLFFTLKVALILVSMVLIFFSYIRVSQRVWANTARQEKVMDLTKLRKSRSVHIRATIHSGVQILLILLTLTPYLYEETSQATHLSTRVQATNSEAERNRAQAETQFNHLARLLGLTLNYTLLVLGTPIAYIASCHRFREQFASLLFGNMSYSRQFFRKLSPSGGRTPLAAHAQRTSATHRHLVTNHNNNHIGHRLINIKPRPVSSNLLAANAHKVSGTNSTRSSSLNSSSTPGSRGTRMGFKSGVNMHQNHLQTVTKATSDIISTLSLHHFQHQAKLVFEPSQSTSSSASSMDSGFTSKPKAPMSRGFSLDHDNAVRPKKFYKQTSQDFPVRGAPLTSTSSASTGSTSSTTCSYYNYPQLISYCHSPSGSMSEIYGNKV